jgi:hypothetical protein
MFLVGAVVVVVGLGLGLWLGVWHNNASGVQSGPEGMPLISAPDLASGTSTLRTPVDGITCRTAKDQKVKYHIHVYLGIYVNGQLKRVPAGTGIPLRQLKEHLQDGLFIDNSPFGGCLYWLHVHANDNVIHVESPYRHTFTLGQFFDVWRQPLSRTQVGPAKGTVVAFVNGRRFSGDPRDVPLLNKGVIQLDVGSPQTPFQPVTVKVKGLCGGTQSCAAGAG